MSKIIETILKAMENPDLKHRPSPETIAKLRAAAFSTNPKRAILEVAAEQILATPTTIVPPEGETLDYIAFQAAHPAHDRGSAKGDWAENSSRLQAGKVMFERWHSAAAEDIEDQVQTLKGLGIHNRFFDDLTEHLDAVLARYEDLELAWLPSYGRRQGREETLIEYARTEHARLQTAAIRASRPDYQPPTEAPAGREPTARNLDDSWGPRRQDPG